MQIDPEVLKNLSCRVPMEPAKENDAGLDLCNASGSSVVVRANRSISIPAGIKVKIPRGYCGLIYPRSSTFYKRGLMVLLALIDEGYVGPIFTLVYHPGLNGLLAPIIVQPGERLSQLLMMPCGKIEVELVKEMPTTVRGETGFGSTGT